MPNPIISAVPHITTFSVTDPPKISPPADVKNTLPISPAPPPAAHKRSRLWLVFAVVLLALAVVGVYSFNLFPAAVNPFERLYQSNDAAAKKYIDSVLLSINNYYAANSQYPWTGNPPEGYSSLDIASENWISKLSAPSQPPSKIILIQGVDSDHTIHLCYQPQSRANINAAKDDCYAVRFYQQYSASICVSNREYLCFP